MWLHEVSSECAKLQISENDIAEIVLNIYWKMLKKFLVLIFVD